MELQGGSVILIIVVIKLIVTRIEDIPVRCSEMIVRSMGAPV